MGMSLSNLELSATIGRMAGCRIRHWPEIQISDRVSLSIKVRTDKTIGTSHSIPISISSEMRSGNGTSLPRIGRFRIYGCSEDVLICILDPRAVDSGSKRLNNMAETLCNQPDSYGVGYVAGCLQRLTHVIQNPIQVGSGEGS